MKIKDQVVSLGYAEKLKELLVKQESYFTYAEDTMLCAYDCPKEKHKDPTHTIRLMDTWIVAENDWIYTPRCSAFSVAELGEILVGVIRVPEMLFDSIDHPENLTEADMRSIVIITAIENNLVTEEWKEKWLGKV